MLSRSQVCWTILSALVLMGGPRPVLGAPPRAEGHLLLAPGYQIHPFNLAQAAIRVGGQGTFGRGFVLGAAGEASAGIGGVWFGGRVFLGGRRVFPKGVALSVVVEGGGGVDSWPGAGYLNVGGPVVAARWTVMAPPPVGTPERAAWVGVSWSAGAIVGPCFDDVCVTALPIGDISVVLLFGSKPAAPSRTATDREDPFAPL
ncbi:MAG: hypothetical protein KDA24_25010 [Deltaproteobacteria bacterium]|nr:hypothetical protein [Deltaproteobacteria bacterium]